MSFLSTAFGQKSDRSNTYFVSSASIKEIGQFELPLQGGFSSQGVTRFVASSTPTLTMSFDKVNDYYKRQFSSLSENIYQIAPELTDPKIPLRDSFELDAITGSIFRKIPVKMLKKPEVGLFGKVKFVHLKNDSNVERWFAVKRPMSLFNQAFKTGHNIDASLKYYENNLSIALKIGDHPNFMKVHGIVVKERLKKAPKPYLILEYIDGTRIKDAQLSAKESLEILIQLKNALIHLFDKGVLPVDTNLGNFLITKDNVLKFIDYDAWVVNSSHDQLASSLYAIACKIVKQLANDNYAVPIIHLKTKLEFERAMTQLIQHYSSFTS